MNNVIGTQQNKVFSVNVPLRNNSIIINNIILIHIREKLFKYRQSL